MDNFEPKNPALNPPPPPRPEENAASGRMAHEYPLSQGQRALWFIQQLDPESVALNIVHCARIGAEVDPIAYRRAYQTVVDRHPMLRTTFSSRDGIPYQIVHDHQEVCFDLVDAAGWDEAQIDQRLEREVFRRFNLETGPLFRVLLLTRSTTDHIALLAFHHIVTDMWSIAVILHEFSQIYRSETTGEPLSLKPPRGTYFDHIAREDERLAGPEGDGLRAYWEEQLEGGLPFLNLPTDHPRPHILDSRGAAVTFQVNWEAALKLKMFSETQKVSIQATVLAAFQILLGRYSGQNDILVGFTKARRRPEAARVVGYFVNPILIRANLSGNPDFQSFLQTVDRSLKNGALNDAYPLSLAIQNHRSKRDLSTLPAFQVMFSWQKTTRMVDSQNFGLFALDQAGGTIKLGGLPFESYPLPYHVVPNDLALLVAEAGDELFGTLEYNTELYERESVESIARQLQTLLEDAVAHPSEKIAFLHRLAPAEQDQNLTTFMRQLEAKAASQPGPPAGTDSKNESILQPEYVAPRTPIEEALLSVWSELLETKPTSIHDNFFELGGHSLLATQVVARLYNIFQVELPLRLLFEAPTIAALAGQVENLLLHEASTGYPPILPADRSSPLPLSFAQERIWFVHQLDPNSTAYNIAGALRLSGPVDVEAFQKSLDEMVRRHDSLRTRFDIIEGQPVQIIEDALEYTIPFIDLSDLPEPEREERAQQIADQEARATFDLKFCPLFRAALIRLGENDHILSVNVHHIISDAWSGGLMANEFLTLYAAFSRGTSAYLPSLPVQYPDFAVWQRQWLQGPVLDDHLAYWKRQLAGLPTFTLPISCPRPTMQSYRGDEIKFKFSPQLMDSLNRISQREGSTLFMTFLAAFSVLLYRYTSQADFAIGSFIANRKWQAIENLIGTFVNLLVLRTDLSGNPTFSEMLHRVRETSLEAFAHQDMPFEKLVAELEIERDMSRTPLVQVMFNLVNFPFQDMDPPVIESTPFDVHRKGAQFDLLLTVIDTAKRHEATFEYNSDLFDAEDIQRMAGHFEALLVEVAEDPEKPISEYSLLAEGEKSQLLEGWNDTAAAYPFELTVQNLFEAQVERTPDAVAVIDEKETLTYRELNRRANLLAHVLRSKGVRPETLVGAYIERSANMVACLMGILKAGGAYVPLDPAYPKERLSFIIPDSGITLVVSQEKYLSELQEYRVETIFLEQVFQDAVKQEGAVWLTNPPCLSTAENLIYVVYTSGSTGTPKGVLGLQRGSLNRFHWMWENYPFHPGDIACQKTALNFVDSIWEIFGPLLQGVKTVVAPDAVVRDPVKLVDFLAEQRVTRIVLVPSLLQALLDVPGDLHQRLRSLCFWVSSGEALPLHLAQRFHEILPGRLLINLYGSSEVAADSTCYETKAQESLASVPIGRPISNTRIYLLDHHLHLVPTGVPGELHIGGLGLARGYLNRPDLTAEKFIANPIQGKKEDLLYKTGDLARYLPDGSLEYLGRIDNQVKIRGIRIELGEVEYALEQHPAVGQAVAAAFTMANGDKRLVAYVTLRPRMECSWEELRGFMKAKLPDPMVPAIYVCLESLPLTPNGKIDRKALPSPEFSQLERNRVREAPRNKLEEDILAIWEEVLGVHPLGVRDNFFEVGGHSLLVLKLFVKLENLTGVSLPLASIFQSPTVEELARRLSQEETQANPTHIIQIKKGDTRPPLFLIHGFGGEIVGYGELAHLLDPQQTVYGIRALGLDGAEEVHSTIEEMAAYYIQGIRSIQPEGPYYLGGYCFGGVVAYEVARQLEAQSSQIALLAIFEGYAPLLQRVNKMVGLAKFTNFLSNARYWFWDLLKLEKTALLARLRKISLRLPKGLWRKIHPTTEIDLRDFIDGDISQIPVMERRLMEIHILSQQNYVPQKLNGKISLYRVRGLSPFRSHDPTLGWALLTNSGVDVHLVEGAHFNLMMRPQVCSLAEKLTSEINRA